MTESGVFYGCITLSKLLDDSHQDGWTVPKLEIKVFLVCNTIKIKHKTRTINSNLFKVFPLFFINNHFLQ